MVFVSGKANVMQAQAICSTPQPGAPLPGRWTTLAIASGKGGVGKTSVVANLAGALSAAGPRVIVLDADFGLSNLDVLLGLAPRYHVGHLLSGERTLAEVLVEAPGGFQILPAASGIQELTDLGQGRFGRLLSEVCRLSEQADFLLVDTAAGISENVTELLVATERAIIVTDPEPTALVDAYALIKVMQRLQPGRRLEVLVNSVNSAQEAATVFKQIERVAHRFLSGAVDLFGWVALDTTMSRAVREQKLVVHQYPNSRAAESFRQLAGRLLENSPSRGAKRSTVIPFPLGMKEAP
jgi:flagellar biosynthesis protein FlhG